MSEDETKPTEGVGIPKAEYDRQVEVNNTLKAQLTDLEKKFDGIDREKYTKYKADSDALQQRLMEEAQNSGNQQDIDALIAAAKKDVRDELQPNLDEYETELAKAQATIHELQVVDKAFSKVSSLFNDDTHEFIKEKIRKFIATDEQGNLIVRDSEKNTRYAPGSANKPFTVEDFGKELTEQYPSFARPNVSSGSKKGNEKFSANGTSDEVNRYLNMTADERKKLPMQDRMRLASAAVKQTN